MSQSVVAPEVAEQEFERFLEAMDLKRKTEAKEMDAEDKKSFASIRRTILTSMEQGHLVIDEQGQPVFTPQMGDKTPVVFPEPTGADMMAMDQAKRGHDTEKGHKLLASITKQNAGRFAKMVRRDLIVCEALLAVFLAQ